MSKFRLAVVGVLAAALLLTQALPAFGGPQAATAVKVTATEFSLKLSKRAVKKGTVVFSVTNKGAMPHDFKVAGKKTAQIAPGATAKVKVVFKKAGKYPFVCTVSGHGASGMKGALTVR